MRKLLALLLALFMLPTLLCACDNTDATDNNDSSNTSYTISTNEDLTYSYKIIANNGAVLFSDDCSPKEPKIDQISDNVLSATVQTGTGRSTNWAVFCDIANAKTSETFRYVLGAQDNYVFYVEFKDDHHLLVVQDIFDSSIYYKTYTLQDCSSFADPICELTFNSKGQATITYLTGTETAISQTSATIYFP